MGTRRGVSRGGLLALISLFPLEAAEPPRFYLHDAEFDKDGVLSVWYSGQCIVLRRSSADQNATDCRQPAQIMRRYEELYAELSQHPQRTLIREDASLQFLGIDIAMEINYPHYCVRYCDEGVR
jgi:hypothetical protein